MKVAVPREIHLGERRVAATPDTVRRLIKMGFQVSVEAGAGAACSISDADYQQAGATTVASRLELWQQADVVLKVRPPELDVEQGRHEADALRDGAALVSFIWPATNELLVDQLARRHATVLAMDQIPRITRAQKMDALSSMANIAGYRAVIEAASFFGRFFTGQMTAAGKVPPAQVLVIGAGVAGLAAVGTARGLGAIVKAFDTRSVVKEQVQSMGAEFLEINIAEDGAGLGGYAKEVSPAFLAAEKELFLREARTVDIIITTALVPGKPAPKLVFADMVKAMRPGSVIVDLAAEAGGNCELTEPGKVVVKEGVTIIGYVDLPSRLAPTASQLYGTNIVHLLSDMGGGANWHIDHENEVVRGALILEHGERRWPPPAKPAPAPVAPVPSVQKPAPAHTKREPPKTHPAVAAAVLLVLGSFLVGLGFVAPPAFLGHFTVFVLACFIGWQVVWNVKPALHTPLMSVTNAISGIILIGGMLQVSGPLSSPVTALAAIAILLATINVGGGFLVTQRMLSMFHR
jgi:proton-translocating NAD(P)+ transhydrogenase subunit alpha